MSERELQRIEVLSRVADRRMTTIAAAHVLGLTRRQVQSKTLQVDGASGLRHKARGQRSNHQIIDGIRDLTLSLVREHHLDFGPTLAAEKLAEDHGVTVSRETLRKWMAEAGIWLQRKHRRTFHQPRLRREAYGELVQIDGSEHRWFEERGAPCTLLVFIDDATGKLQQLRFVKSESTFSYFEAAGVYLKAHGCPVAFYSDKHTVFRVAKAEARAGRGMTQFGRALSELNIEIPLCQFQPGQRPGRTGQSDAAGSACEGTAPCRRFEEANVFLPAFTADFNEKFAKVPARQDNLHRALNMPPDRLRDVLCKREQRYVGQQLSFSYEGRQIMLEKNDISCGLVGKYVDVYEFADGRLDVRWKACSLPYSVFDKEQRVTHTAITENKRLGEVLSWIKAQQDEARPAPKIKTNSEQNAYRKRGTKPGRTTDFTKDPEVIARRERALSGLAAAE